MARLIRKHADALLAVALAVGLEIEIAATADATHRVGLAAVGLLAALPLALRCRYPLAAFVAVWSGLLLIKQLSPDFDNGSTFFVLIGVFALYSFGANARGTQARVGAAFVFLVAGQFLIDDGDKFHFGDIAFTALVMGGPWLAGVGIRLRRQSERRLEREKKAAEQAVVEERTRIARELHDVVAHAIAVVVLQARGGRSVLDIAPAEARDAFDTIERTGAQALAEMRRLLGLLRTDDEQLALAPQPSLARLDALIADVRQSGLPVELDVVGDPVDLPPGVDLSAYRIVQEALTNALKHAGPARARVTVRYGSDEVELEVADNGVGTANGSGVGHGLTGIRERVSVYGGKLDAGPHANGGYTVRARLPYGDER